MLQSSAYRTKRCLRRSSSRSSSLSTMFDSTGESGPPCGVPSSAGLTSPFSYSGSQERTNQSQQPLIADPFGNLREQSVVIEPVEKFLEIQIHPPAVAFGLILLRLFHRLMCRSLGPKPIAVFGERSVPAPLQRLHHRLLDESIQHRRNAQLAHPAVRLRDFHPFHRFWSIRSAEELFPDGWPVLFQVSRQLLDGHPVDAWTAFVGLHSS